MQWLRLMVVVVAAALAIACILGAYPVVDSVVLRATGHEALASGAYSVSLPLWKFVSWFFYSLLIVMVLAGVCMAAGALGVLTWIADKVIRGVGDLVLTVRGAWNGTSRDTVLIGGKPLGHVLQNFREKILSLERQLKESTETILALEAKTKHLPEPPKPKTPEEELADLRAELLRLKSQPVVKPAAPAAASEGVKANG